MFNYIYNQFLLIINLTHFYCNDNNLKLLPCNMTSKMRFPNLIYIMCRYNKLYYIPPHIKCNIWKDDTTKSPEYMRRKLWI